LRPPCRHTCGMGSHDSFPLKPAPPDLPLVMAGLLWCVMVFMTSPSYSQDVAVYAESPPPRYEILRVAVDAGRPPYQFIADGRLTGFNVEAIIRIGEALGVGIALQAMTSGEGLQALSEGRVDLVLGQAYSPGSAASLDFSEPLASSSIAVLVAAGDERFKDGLADLGSGVVALTRDSPAYDFLKNIRTIRFNETTVPADAFSLLAAGRADAFLEDRLTARYFLRVARSETLFRFAASYWLPVEYTMAVAKGNSYLVFLLNSGLREIKEGGIYGSLYDAWFNDAEYEAQRRLRLILNAFTALLLLSLAAGGLGFWWNRQLASRVRLRTAELHAANDELARQMAETEDRSLFVSQILESSPRGIITCDASGTIVSCNNRARELGGFDIDPIGRHFRMLPLLELLLDLRLEAVLSAGQRFLFQTIEWDRGDGHLIHLRYNLYPYLDHLRKPAGVICTFEDFTEEKLLRDRGFEREKSQALGRIVAGIAHEVRNPLTSIKAFVELLPRKLDNQRFRDELLEIVPREVERVDGLIRNLIDFAKPRQAAKNRENLSELTAASVALLQPLAESRGFKLRFDPKPDMSVFLDRNQYSQCILNLVLNAMDALDEKKDSGSLEPGDEVLSIGLQAQHGRVKVLIRDRGAGMDEEQISRVLEPFYTTKKKGVGLGLPLTRQYIEENNGILGMDSVKGRGTIISVEFPLDRQP
jgi:polar amino acid transport system substrate-binding protein